MNAPAPAEFTIFEFTERLHDQRRQLAEQLDATPHAARQRLVEKAAFDTGGFVIPNQTGSNWDPVDCEVTLLGITGMGASMDAAIAQWIKCAARAAEVTA